MSRYDAETPPTPSYLRSTVPAVLMLGDGGDFAQMMVRLDHLPTVRSSNMLRRGFAGGAGGGSSDSSSFQDPLLASGS